MVSIQPSNEMMCFNIIGLTIIQLHFVDILSFFNEIAAFRNISIFSSDIGQSNSKLLSRFRNMLGNR